MAGGLSRLLSTAQPEQCRCFAIRFGNFQLIIDLRLGYLRWINDNRGNLPIRIEMSRGECFDSHILVEIFRKWPKSTRNQTPKRDEVNLRIDNSMKCLQMNSYKMHHLQWPIKPVAIIAIWATRRAKPTLEPTKQKNKKKAMRKKCEKAFFNCTPERPSVVLLTSENINAC